MRFKMIPLNREEQEIHDGAMAATSINQQSNADLVKWIEQVDRLRIYEKFTQASTFNYCTKILNHTRAKSNALKSVARKSREMPELHAAMEAGLSLWTAAKLCPHLTGGNKDEWFAKVAQLSKSDLELEIAKKSKREKRDHIQNGETHSRVSMELENDVLQLLKRAQDLQTQKGRKRESLNDTLKVVLNSFLDRNDPVRKADRAKPKKYSREETPVSTRPVVYSSVRRPLTASEKAAVNKRDRGCCQAEHPDGEKCGSPHLVEIHHLVAVELGGTNAIENLVTLCGAHHRMHHRHEMSEESLRH